MSDWPELERRLTDSAHRRFGRRWRAWIRLALVPVVGVLAAITLMALLRTPASDERAVTPADERALATPAVGDSARDPDEPTGPGLHDTGLDAAAYGDVTMQPGAANRLTYAEARHFTVVLTNEGENDEFNVKVTVRIRPQGGDPITLNQTVAAIAQGDRVTATLPLDRQPPIGQAVTIEVEVAKVPGEKARTYDSETTDQAPPAGSDAAQFEAFCAENPGACVPKDNNTLRFPALFANGSIASRAVRDTAHDPACQTGPARKLTLVDGTPLPTVTSALPALAAPARDPDAVAATLPSSIAGNVLRSTLRELSFPGDVRAIVFVASGPPQNLADAQACTDARAARVTELAHGGTRAAALAALAARPDAAPQTLTLLYGKGRSGLGGAGIPLHPGSPVPTGILGSGGTDRRGERIYAGIARPGDVTVRVDARTIPVRGGIFAFTRSTGGGRPKLEQLDAAGRVIGPR